VHNISTERSPHGNGRFDFAAKGTFHRAHLQARETLHPLA
jgi:hypothetical protein